MVKGPDKMHRYTYTASAAAAAPPMHKKLAKNNREFAGNMQQQH